MLYLSSENKQNISLSLLPRESPSWPAKPQHNTNSNNNSSNLVQFNRLFIKVDDFSQSPPGQMLE
jgi:hypothetical protein